jgi:hypothetical protein
MEDKAAPADGDIDACATFDDGKIADAVTKLADTIQSKCGDTGLTTDELFLIHSCAADVPTLKTCVANAIEKNASGVNTTSYEFAGICPTEVKMELNSRSPSNARSGVSRTPGWTKDGTGLAMAWTSSTASSHA